MIFFIYAHLIGFNFVFSPYKEDSRKLYTKLNSGSNWLDLYSENKFRQFNGTSFDTSFNVSIKGSNHYIGASVKSFSSKNLLSISYGANYSYLFFLENGSFFSFGFFLGKGKLDRDNSFGKDSISLDSLILAQRFYNNSLNLVDGYLLGIRSGGKIYNFYEINPSIGYEIPIFGKSGFNFSIEFFYSYKKISTENVNNLFSNIYLNANEYGFRLGVTKFRWKKMKFYLTRL